MPFTDPQKISLRGWLETLKPEPHGITYRVDGGLLNNIEAARRMELLGEVDIAPIPGGLFAHNRMTLVMIDNETVQQRNARVDAAIDQVLDDAWVDPGLPDPDLRHFEVIQQVEVFGNPSQREHDVLVHVFSLIPSAILLKIDHVELVDTIITPSGIVGGHTVGLVVKLNRNMVFDVANQWVIIHEIAGHIWDTFADNHERAHPLLSGNTANYGVLGHDMTQEQVAFWSATNPNQFDLTDVAEGPAGLAEWFYRLPSVVSNSRPADYTFIRDKWEAISGRTWQDEAFAPLAEGDDPAPVPDPDPVPDPVPDPDPVPNPVPTPDPDTDSDLAALLDETSAWHAKVTAWLRSFPQ
jgi:hypothetical protein